jgi:hypothetical protein
MRTQRFIAYAFTVCLVVLSAGSAMAFDERGNPNELLKGKYRFSQNNTCAIVLGPGGFTDQLVTLGDGFPAWLYLTGVATYDGIGTVTVKDHGIFIGGPGPSPFSQGNQPVSTFADNCSGTYEVNPQDRSFIQKMSCTATDGSYTLTGIKFKGQIDPEGSVLTMSSAEPVIQTAVGNGFANKRICGAHVTSVRMHQK